MFHKLACSNGAILILSVGLALRSIVSLYNYSGYNKPETIFGDFEAQRHWQEITVNLPVNDWYRNTTDNDLLYWGLDYPPLTAYHSFVLGKIAQKINASYVELHKSRGITDKNHKNFMRNTVLITDLLIYLPALLLACQSIFQRLLSKYDQFRKLESFLMIFWSIAIFYPGQILIDNGHFQYNNVSLGLTVFAIAAIISDRNLIGSGLFVLAINYKQMELYHALPFFVYLLMNSFRDPVRNL
jgi:alpha-1,3-glucosyltransferase